MAELPRFCAEAASESDDRSDFRIGGVITDYCEAEEINLATDHALVIAGGIVSLIRDSSFDWEVLDREATASRRVLCRATRARAVMIAEALNAAVPR